MEAFKIKKELELYIHIPFCVKKCAYCDFLSSVQNEKIRENYVNALVREINAYGQLQEQYIVSTIFIGGGTPTILSELQMQKIFKALHAVFEINQDAEITIEANPGTVTKEKLNIYRMCGINRISFGLQSVNNEELRLLGRIHTYEEFLESYYLAREVGFTNINVDLISAIPKQTLSSWEETLKNVIALNPEHISAYSLIIEEGTPFANVYGKGAPKEDELPSEEEERNIYYRTKELLKEFGYQQYEISNYAKDGNVCKHNSGYWKRKEYLGIGLGSASLLNHTRFHNTDDLSFYLEHAGETELLRQEIQILSIEEQMEEFMFLGLRMTEGISKKEFEACFGKTIDVCYEKQLQKLQKQEMIEISADRIALTDYGLDVSNYVLSEFIL